MSDRVSIPTQTDAFKADFERFAKYVIGGRGIKAYDLTEIEDVSSVKQVLLDLALAAHRIEITLEDECTTRSGVAL